MSNSRSIKLLSKSRSPALPPTPTQSTPRPFLPPSHYAAAGGFTSPGSSAVRRSGGTSTNWQGDENTNRTHFRSPEPEPSDSESLLNLATREAQQRHNAQGIPNLETQLLPSLRDTIDRMTCAPSRASSQYKTGGGTDKRASRSQNRRNSPNLTSVSSPMPKNSHSQLYSPRNNDTAMSPNIYSEQPTPTTSRLKAPVKSALKSSFRSPMSASASPKSSVTPTASPSIAGSSLRSMKSLLSRKCSGTLKSPFNSNKASPRKEAEITEKKEPEHTPRLSSKKSFQSNIPRPRTRYYNEDPPPLEDSDLERRYEEDLRNRRKLRVANAAISLSSSESDVDSRNEYFKNINHVHTVIHHDKPAVGLGLSLSHNASPRTPRPSDARSSTPEKTLRFSLPGSESASSYYSDENNHLPHRSRQADDAEVDNRARGRMPFNNHADDFQSALKIPPDTWTTQPRGERRHSPQQQKNRNPSPTYSPSILSMEDEETESEREGYSIRHSKGKDAKRRSSSCEPRLPPDEEESSDGAVPIVSRRPQSACQRERPPSPRTSRMFPPNLRDLIKSRHSFSKLPPPVSRKDAAATIPPPMPVSSPCHPPSIRHEAQSSSSKAKHSSPSSPASRVYNAESLRSRLGKHRNRTEASAIVDGYRFAAARERMAFGIPPSDSDEVLRKAVDEQGFSHTESEASSLNRTMWQDEESEELSVDTESIFKAMDYNRSKKDIKREEEQQRMYAKTPRLSIISPTVSSVYGESIPENIWTEPDTLVQNSYTDHEMDKKPPHHTTDPYPPAYEIPKTREGVIQEIFESEEELLRLFHICMQVFVLPLRTQNSRSWISGVPPNIAKLLDWFDDIVNLHEQVYASLCLARDTMSPATDRVSESLRCFVLKAEVYQPYLVRLSDLSQEIILLTRNPKDDLGQFINIQQRLAECEGWTFDRLLMLPVNRLAAYQDLFARLLDLTPKEHQDYLSTFSLSRSTDMVIRVMTEVKIREDEYNLLKTFSLRIQGLPSPNELATRQRRLLHSGILALVISGLATSKEEECNSSGSRLRQREANRTKRVSKMLDVISTSSSTIFERSDSVKSSSTGSSFGSNIPATSTPIKSPASSWFSRLPLRKRSAQKSPIATALSPVILTQPPRESPSTLMTVSVHAFIFNDLVLLAQPSQTLGKEPHWILSKDLGAFRPLSIAQIQTHRKEGIILSLESMTVDLDQLNEPADFRTTSFCTVDLLLPRAPNELFMKNLDNSGMHELSEKGWLLAFRKCCKTTLRKITFLGSDHSDDFFTSSDRTLDTHVAVSSLVTSGLPIPRSPSGTYPDMRGGADGAFLGDEREERGWWSLRYQQVFREFQRQESLLDDDELDNL